MAGGLAGGLLGNMLFGSRGYAGSGYGGGYGGGGGGGIGLMDIIILGVIGYFLYRWWSRRRRAQTADATYFAGGTGFGMEEPSAPPMSPYYGSSPQDTLPEYDEVQAGFQQIRQQDPSFNEEAFKELAQDLFFRIQAGWMNRSLEGIENLFVPEMSRFFTDEFNAMKQKGTVNRLENIAVRKVEPSEVWQEVGKDFITVLFTANLLDYTVDDKTGNVVSGDKLNPVKFEEFWTFARDIGTQQWKLSAINQVGQPLPRYN
jgi:predicted lipid-binding transport protein (Tim44 family)